MAEKENEKPSTARNWVARGFTAVEDTVYVGLGVLLAASAVVLLVTGGVHFVEAVGSGAFAKEAVNLLDQILLILLVVELLYTVQVSFREHALVPEPFLLVGLIAAIRRVLVLTAEFGQMQQHAEEEYRHFFIELSILTFLILVVTISLMLLRRGSQPKAERAV
jgi:uncharacterized membrane protein (DUF373 family)